MTKRSQHWLDEPAARGRKRTIKNWMHYRAPQAESKLVADDSDPWLDVKTKAKPPNGIIPKWTGNIDMAFASLDAPLQAFAGDTTDAKNSALWGVRCADRPNSWANWKAYGVVEGVSPRIDEDEAGNVIGATWHGLWPGSDLEIRHAGHKVTKMIVIRERSAPAHYEFTLKIAGGHDAVQVGDTLSIRDAQGVERIRTMPLSAWDSATTGIGPDGHQYFAPTLKRMADVTIKGGGKAACYAIDIDPRDLASAVLPLYIDPTTTISGAAAIEDTCLLSDSGHGDKNWGSLTQVYMGNSGARRALYRIKGASIPVGVITSAVLQAYTNNPAGTVTVTTHRVASSDAGYVTGTGMGAVQAGSCCWNWKSYNTVPWSAAGCGYVTDGTQQSVSLVTGVSWRSYAWHPSWLVSGADAQAISLCSGANGLGTYSVEWPTTKPYFEITYALGGAAAMLARRIHE